MERYLVRNEREKEKRSKVNNNKGTLSCFMILSSFLVGDEKKLYTCQISSNREDNPLWVSETRTSTYTLHSTPTF
jgi:hypothetical protein